MSTTTCRPDGSLSMTGNDVPPARQPACYVEICAVRNGWIVYAHEHGRVDHYQHCGSVKEPTHVFNNVEDLVNAVRAMLKPDAGNKHLVENSNAS